jgi:hypothetical protein
MPSEIQTPFCFSKAPRIVILSLANGDPDLVFSVIPNGRTTRDTLCALCFCAGLKPGLSAAILR